MINILIFILLLALISVLAVSTRFKGIITVFTVILLGVVTGFIAIRALTGNNYEVMFAGTVIFGPVSVLVDALSGWFILTINFTFITGALYGFNYMKKYLKKKKEITLHCIAFVLAQFALLAICSVQNAFIFLLFWELIALSMFILVIFEHQKPDTIKAGLNYLVQSHLSILFIMSGFIYVAYKTGSYGFDAITDFSMQQSSYASAALFLFFFVGFAIKSGFVPFHTWLPYAHPAAPSHISGIMSGVVIKIGIYGILRMLLLLKTDYTVIGYFILFISLLTGIYGVILAIIQHNLKKLLAYHSIENIGIIGIGIGIGCIGLGTSNEWMSVLGFSGALLHTLNHSLFKSLLFYSAGNVYQSVHTMNIERLGGLIKKMPKTAILFLLAAIAICGLPPLNGFVSEFLIFGGIYNWLQAASQISLIALVIVLGGFVFIGGLALFCFTKAFSIVFLGNQRDASVQDVHERGFWQLFPMFMTATLMIIIGLFPSVFISAVHQPVSQFTDHIAFDQTLNRVKIMDSFQVISWLSGGFILFVLILLGLKNYFIKTKKVEIGPTWGCGYSNTSSKLQYTAGSFAKSFSKLAKPLLEIEKKEEETAEIFPSTKHFETGSYDKIERFFIDKPVKLINKITDYFTFLQNGQLQSYIIYGIIFITAILCVPFLFHFVTGVLKFLNNI
jgi:hydrogenase-4 component B